MDVSILIPVRDGLDLTRACLASIRQTLPDALRVEILIFDDGSTDGTAAFLAELGGRVAVHRRPTRGNFSSNMNHLAAKARGRYLVLLNNDTVVRPGWLTSMLDVVHYDPRAGVVGGLQIFMGTDLTQHAGVVFDDECIPRHLYEGMPADLPAVRQRRRLQAVSAACWLTPADLYRELGGLDEGYHYGHEDLDYCFRARQVGRHVWYAGDSVIEHRLSSTPGRFDRTDANHRRFVERWGGAIRADLTAVVEADGLVWPQRSRAYRVARRLWRTTAVRALLTPLIRTRWGASLRQQALRELVREPSATVAAPPANPQHAWQAP